MTMNIINLSTPQLQSNGQKMLTQFNRQQLLRNNLATLADDIESHAAWMADELRKGGDLNESFAYFNEAVGKFYAMLNGEKEGTDTL